MMADWRTVRAAVGVMKGAPADAIEDTERLYDGEREWTPDEIRRANLALLVGLGTCPMVRRGLSVIRPIEMMLMRRRRGLF